MRGQNPMNEGQESVVPTRYTLVLIMSLDVYLIKKEGSKFELCFN